MERPTKTTKNSLPSTDSKLDNIVDDGIIEIRMCKVNCFAKYMCTLMINCIQDPFSTGCSIRMVQFNRNWECFDDIKASQSLPQTINAMAI